MSTPQIADEVAEEPQPTVDPALNIQPHRQSPTPAPKYETANSGHSSPQSARSNHKDDKFQDINPLLQSTQHELRAIEVTNPMSSASEQQTPELNSNFAPESAISRETYINVQSSTIPERNDGPYLDKNASPAEVTDYLRGLQSKLDTILKSSVVLHQSPMTSPVKSHSTFPTKDMYSPSTDLFKFSNNFSDFNSFKARPVENSVYASVNNDAKFFSAREAPKSSYISNRYDTINSSVINVNGSMVGKARTMDIVGSPLTTMSTYIPTSSANQYSGVQRDRSQQIIETMKNNEAKLDQIIENIRRKNAGGAVSAVKTTESRVNTMPSPHIYESRATIASPQTMTRKTEFYQPGETLKKSNFVSVSEYSSVQSRDREKKRSFQHDRQASISNSYWLDNQEKSRYLGASTISNTHVPLKLRADRNNPADQGDREIVKEEGHQKIQRYYIPDPTIKERDTKDLHDMRAVQSRPMQFGHSNTGPSRREYRNIQHHLEVLEDDSAFHCQDLEDDNQSELGDQQAQNQEPVKVNHEEFIYGGSETFSNKRRHQSKVEKPKVVVTKKNVEKVSQVQVQTKKEPSSGVERSQPGSSISKFFEKDSEIDDFVFE